MDLPMLQSQLRLLFKEWKQSSPFNGSVDLIIQKLSQALQNLLESAQDNLSDYRLLFFQHLQHCAPHHYKAIVESLPPAFRVADADPSILLWGQFQRIMKILLDKQYIVDLSNASKKIKIFLQENDELKLSQAKQLQLQYQSPTLWPYLQSVFTDYATFVHYAEILHRSFQTVCKMRADFLQQSEPFDRALFPEPKPAPKLPSSSRKRKAVATETMAAETLHDALPSNDLVKINVQEEDSDFLTSVYDREEDPPLVLSRKVVRLNNPYLYRFPDLDELNRELLDESRVNVTEVGEESGAAATDTENWVSPSNIVDKDMIARVVAHRLASTRNLDDWTVTPQALRVLSEGLQFHLRNMVEHAILLEGSSAAIPLQSLPGAARSRASFSLFGPKKGPDEAEDDDPRPEFPLYYDLDSVVVPKTQRTYRRSMRAMAALSAEELSLKETAEVLRRQARKQLQEEEKSLEEEQRAELESLVHYTEAVIKGPKRRKTLSQQRKLLTDVLLRHSSSQLLPGRFLAALKLYQVPDITT